MLTIIAGCLLALVLRRVEDPPRVAAQQLDGLRVVIAGFDVNTLGRGVPVNIVGSGDSPGVPVTLIGGGRDGRQGLPVSVVNPVVPVSLIGAGPDGRAAVPVNVTQVAARNVGNAGVPIVATSILPVNVAEVGGGQVGKEGIPTIAPGRVK
jgi:hypothetical protein